MKNKRILLLLIFIILLTACSPRIQVIETSTEDFTNYENENIRIEIHNDIDEKENVYNNILEDLQKINDFSSIEDIEIRIAKKYSNPDIVSKKTIRCDDEYLETENFKKQLIKIAYGLHDSWIVEGLYKKIFNMDTEVINFVKYYEDNDFSLFGARFFEPFSSKEEIENIESASADLVEYLLNSGKKIELLENNIVTLDMEDWAKDRNIDLSYQKEIESLMNIEVMKNETKLIINTEREINGFNIEIPHEDEINEQYDTAEKIEQIILRFDRDILAIKKGIEKDAPNFYKDYEEVLNNVPKLRYFFDDTIATGGFFYGGLSKVSLRSMPSQPHEYSHYLFHDPFMRQGIIINKPAWLGEGIAEYLSIAYSEAYDLVMEDVLYGIFNWTSDSSDKRSLINDELKIMDEVKIIMEKNIDFNKIKENSKDKTNRLIFNYIVHLTNHKLYKVYETKEEFEDGFNETASSGIMSEEDNLDYYRNFSFMSYIIEEYGLEKILYLNVADFSKLTYEEVFGKSFEELEIDWINHLKENIKDIELLL